jgi:copper(I)-binding protein
MPTGAGHMQQNQTQRLKQVTRSLVVLGLAACVLVAASCVDRIAEDDRYGGDLASGAGDAPVQLAHGRTSEVFAPSGIAVYLTLRNRSDAAIKILGFEVDEPAMAMLHQTKIDEDGRSTMHSHEPLSLQPGEELVMEPGGVHLMVTGLDEASVTRGFSVRARLESGSLIESTVVAVPPDQLLVVTDDSSDTGQAP